MVWNEKKWYVIIPHMEMRIISYRLYTISYQIWYEFFACFFLMPVKELQYGCGTQGIAGNDHPRPRSCSPVENTLGLSLRGLCPRVMRPMGRAAATRAQSPADTFNTWCLSDNNRTHALSVLWEQSNLELLPQKQS